MRRAMSDDIQREPRMFGPYDHANPPPLDFEAWAEIGARLFERDADAQLRILESRQLEPDLWDACNEFWTTELAGQLQHGNLRLARRYGKICANEMRQRHEAKSHVPQPPPATAVDETAFLIALPDETALPFKRPERLDALATSPDVPEAPPPSGKPVSTEETALVPALKPSPEPLPFRKPDDDRGSKSR